MHKSPSILEVAPIRAVLRGPALPRADLAVKVYGPTKNIIALCALSLAGLILFGLLSACTPRSKNEPGPSEGRNIGDTNAAAETQTSTLQPQDSLSSKTAASVPPTQADAPSRLRPITAAELKRLVAEPGATATVVNLWATWCAPCKEEMPELVEFEKSYRSRGVRLVLVSADSQEDLRAAAEFLKTAGVEFPSYHLGEPPDTFAKEFEPRWSATLPTTFLFNAEGRQTKFFVGKTDAKTLGTKVEAIIAAPLASPSKK